jgi:hypothetical protein
MVDPPRQTRQRTTRSNHEFSLEQHPSVPRLRSRSRSRMGSSPLSSLSPSPTKLAHRLPIITTTTGEASNSVAVPQIVPITQAPTRTHTKAAPVRPSRDKGKGKAVPIQGQLPAEAKPGKRVLPARIRRAAGGGQEGFRDLEDIIVDWLTRYGMLTLDVYNFGCLLLVLMNRLSRQRSAWEFENQYHISTARYGRSACYIYAKGKSFGHF